MFKLASEAGQSYRWWEYVTKFGEECTMADKKYDSACAERVRASCKPAEFTHNNTSIICVSQNSVVFSQNSVVQPVTSRPFDTCGNHALCIPFQFSPYIQALASG